MRAGGERKAGDTAGRSDLPRPASLAAHALSCRGWRLRLTGGIGSRGTCESGFHGVKNCQAVGFSQPTCPVGPRIPRLIGRDKSWLG